jgi:hypothetical protein
LPKKFFNERGRLREPQARWDAEKGAWEFTVQLHRDTITLTGADLDRYAAAYQEITEMPLEFGLPPGGPRCQ